MKSVSERWKKLGCLYSPENFSDIKFKYASHPAVQILDSENIQIFYNSRDSNNRSHIFSLKTNIHRHEEIFDLMDHPHLSPSDNQFDCDGISIGSICKTQNQLNLYYVGWNISAQKKWNNTIGLASKKSTDAHFLKSKSNPIIDLSALDSYSVSYPFVIQENPHEWLMWYGSDTSMRSEAFEPTHEIHLATSEDGIHWIPKSKTNLIPQASEGETAFSRPSVLKENGVYKMWYSLKKKNYTIGYAESKDGIIWQRSDEFGLSPSPIGWDSESVEYPCVFEKNDKKYMLYCGNHFGRSGFGLAVYNES